VPAEKKSPNRLIHEKSPYLLPHACNPVGWYPWGEGTFAKAKAGEENSFLTVALLIPKVVCIMQL